jgi:hypothetical protein
MSKTKPLTALKVAKIKEPGRYPDGGGLYLAVGPTGAKSWLFRYQLAGRERFMGLGSAKSLGARADTATASVAR